MQLIIVIHKPYKSITKYASHSKEVHDIVYNTLTRYGIDTFQAIECASWCEIAPIGESYNEENFDVYIEDDR